MHYDKAIDDRLRRIETKLTRLIIALDVESQTPPPAPAERPQDGHCIVDQAEVPSLYGITAKTLLKAFRRV